MITKVKFLYVLTFTPFYLLTCQSSDSRLQVLKQEKQQISVKVTAPDTNITVDYLMGKFEPSKHIDFVEIPLKYADRAGLFIRKEVFNAFVKMYDAAILEGIQLQIRSATRNYHDQKRIWENKWNGKTLLEDNINAATEIKNELQRAKKILEYSSMPGTSRHHWGTDIDINSFDNAWFEKGEGQKLYTWMKKNASAYGFCQPYSAIGSDRKTGYFEERWHWTYVPLSSRFTEKAKILIQNDMISGFLGADTATQIDMLQNYILGISPLCIQN